MRLDIFGTFVVSVVTSKDGWSKGRPIALIEDGDRWRIADLLIPNGLTDRALETYVADKFSSFDVGDRPIRRLHDHDQVYTSAAFNTDRPRAEAQRILLEQRAYIGRLIVCGGPTQAAEDRLKQLERELIRLRARSSSRERGNDR